MKIEDRIQALKRSTKYRNDYKKYDEYRKRNNVVDSFLLDYLAPLRKISKEGQRLCRKYKVPYPFNPDEEIIVLPGSQAIPSECVMKVPSVLPIPLRKTKDGKHIFGLVDKQYLNVTIDMTRPKHVILRDLERLCQHYKAQIESDKRDKGSDVDCWEIYDFVEEQKQKGAENLRLIADLFYKKRKLSYHIEPMSAYMRVRRAYYKAKSIIKEFERGG